LVALVSPAEGGGEAKNCKSVTLNHCRWVTVR
jgi:hypothetical protein